MSLSIKGRNEWLIIYNIARRSLTKVITICEIPVRVKTGILIFRFKIQNLNKLIRLMFTGGGNV